MDITQEEFDSQFRETLDTVIVALAEHHEVDVKNFYNLTCFLENLSFFSPVLYDLLQNAKSNNQ